MFANRRNINKNEVNKMGMLKRIISVLIIMVVMIGVLSISNSVQALTLSDMSTKISTFKANGSTTISTSEITSEFAGLAKILTTLGAGVLVIVITYMGIKYFISSPEEQAKLKQQMRKNSSKVAMLCDSTKFNKTFLCTDFQFNDIDYLITEKTPPIEYVEKIARTKCKIITPQNTNF